MTKLYACEHVNTCEGSCAACLSVATLDYARQLWCTHIKGFVLFGIVRGQDEPQMMICNRFESCGIDCDDKEPHIKDDRCPNATEKCMWGGYCTPIEEQRMMICPDAETCVSRHCALSYNHAMPHKRHSSCETSPMCAACIPAEQSNTSKLKLGIYKIFWKDGGSSIASVGQDAQGNRWFAPVNWIKVPCFDWGVVKRVEGIVSWEELKPYIKMLQDEAERLEQIIASKERALLAAENQREELREQYSDIIELKRRYRRERDDAYQKLSNARDTLEATGIVGIYDVFTDLPDAISQMAQNIKENASKHNELQAELEAANEEIAELEGLYI